jgi:hypothetical protein
MPDSNNLRHELIDYETANDSHLRWIVTGFVLTIAVLAILNWLILRAICSDAWYIKLLGLPVQCKTTAAVLNLPNAGKSTQRLELTGNTLSLSDGGGSITLDLAGAAGPTGPAGAKGMTGATGATGASGGGGGTLNDAYNFGGPAAGRSINIANSTSPVQAYVPISAGPFGIGLGMVATGDGSPNNPTSSGVGWAKLVGDFGGGVTNGSATIYSHDISNFASGTFGFNAFLDYPGSEIYVQGLNNTLGGSFGTLSFTTLGTSLNTGEGPTATSNGLGVNIGTGNGGAVSGDGGGLNFGTGSASGSGNGGNVFVGTGNGLGASGTGGNFFVGTGTGTQDGGSIYLNSGEGFSNNGGNIGFGAGNGGNNGGSINFNAGYGVNNGGSIGITAGNATNNNGGSYFVNAGQSINGAGGNIGFNGGNGFSGGGGFNFSGGNDTSGVNGGGGANFNLGSGAFGGNFSVNAGSGAINAGNINLNAGVGSIFGSSNGGAVNIGAGSGFQGGTATISGGNSDGSVGSNGGSVTLLGGNADNAAGWINLFPGNSNNGPAGGIYANAGNGTNGGNIQFYGGSANGGSNGTGGNFSVLAGTGDGVGAAGNITLNAGTSSSAAGGYLSFNAGNGQTAGGDAAFLAGSANGGSGGNGGVVSLISGSGDGLGNGGNVAITTGTGTLNGAIVFSTGFVERARFDEAAGEFLVNTTTPVAGKVAVFNGDIKVSGVIDPVELQFSGTPINGGGYRITTLDDNPIYLNTVADRSDAVQIRRADNTTVVFNADTLNQRVGIGTSSADNTLTVEGNTNVHGHLALGDYTASVNDGSLLWPGSTFDTIQSNQEVLTDGTVNFAEGITNYVSLNPTSAPVLVLSDRLGLKSGSGSYQAYGADNEIETNAANGFNFGLITGSYGSAKHSGSGNVAYLSGLEGVAYNAGAGSVSNVIGGAFQAGNTGSGSVTNSVGLDIENNFNSGGGSVDTNIGLLVKDQSGVGSTYNFNIYSQGNGSVNAFDGQVGIGTLTPTNKLDVVDNSDDSVSSFTGASGTCVVDTNAGALNCVSDQKLKTNILSIDNGLETLLKLQGVTYNWKTNPDGTQVAGFIAQDVQKVLPNLVTSLPDGTLTLNKEGIMPYIVEAVKQQNGNIDGVNQQLKEYGLQLTDLSDQLKDFTKRLDDQGQQLKDQQQQIDELKAELKQIKSNQLPTSP